MRSPAWIFERVVSRGYRDVLTNFWSPPAVFAKNITVSVRNFGVWSYPVHSNVKLYDRANNKCRSISIRAAQKIARMPKGTLIMTKIDGEIFQSLFNDELTALAELFKKYDYEIRLAGGPVRDLLSGKKPADLDFATTATPDEMKAMFEREGVRMINTKGEKHGTITARINDKENYEVTTLRIDVATDGRHAEVEFTKNWELDAGRRDLTVNSMFLDLDGNVYDYFDGMTDLKNKRIRFVGNPVDRILEDYLRILRYFRFYGRLARDADSHEKVTLDAIRNNVDGLARISGERIWVELKKTLSGNFAGELVLLMLELGIGPYVGIPESANLEEFRLVYERMKTNNIEMNPITLLSALLRDEAEAKALHTRLKLSAFERDLCIFVVMHRDKLCGPLEEALQLCQQITLLNAQFTHTILRAFIEEALKYNGNMKLLQSYQAWDCPKFPINGRMLLERGMKGKQITLVMTEIKRRWIASDFRLTYDDMVKLILPIHEEVAARSPSPKRSKSQKAAKS